MFLNVLELLNAVLNDGILIFLETKRGRMQGYFAMLTRIFYIFVIYRFKFFEKTEIGGVSPILIRVLLHDKSVAMHKLLYSAFSVLPVEDIPQILFEFNKLWKGFRTLN